MLWSFLVDDCGTPDQRSHRGHCHRRHHSPLSEADATELIETAGGDAAAATFHVAVPEEPTSASMDAVMNDWELGVAAGRGVGSHTIADNEQSPGAIDRHEAGQVLATSIQLLSAAGAKADGEVTSKHPLDSIGDMVAHLQPDEVVVMVRHPHLDELTQTDLAAKIRRAIQKMSAEFVAPERVSASFLELEGEDALEHLRDAVVVDRRRTLVGHR